MKTDPSHAIARTTVFSPCRQYRYTLWREWEEPEMGLLGLLASGCFKPGGYLMVIVLNPSTADESRDDPTIRRCVGFAKEWGFQALCMTNLFAWRDTDPAKMKAAMFPVGGDNDMWLLNCASGAGLILAAWGNHGSFLDRGKTVLADLRDAGRPVHALGRNQDGSPKHPLYVAASTEPVPIGWHPAYQP
jgi:hypothetical protein